jgi:hypothetical protein
MKTLSTRILVEVDMEQKRIADGLLTAKEFQGNYRERQPVMCKVIQGNELVKKGLTLLVHHNFFYDESPYRVIGNVYAIKTNENIFARLDVIGNAHSMFGNIIAERVPMGDAIEGFEIPEQYQKFYPDRVRVISDGCGYKVGQMLLILEKADYEIVYNWQGSERKVIRVKRGEIVGYLKKEI